MEDHIRTRYVWTVYNRIPLKPLTKTLTKQTQQDPESAGRLPKTLLGLELRATLATVDFYTRIGYSGELVLRARRLNFPTNPWPDSGWS